MTSASRSHRRRVRWRAAAELATKTSGRFAVDRSQRWSHGRSNLAARRLMEVMLERATYASRSQANRIGVWMYAMWRASSRTRTAFENAGELLTTRSYLRRSRWPNHHG